MKEQMMHPKEKHALYFDVAPNIWGTKDVFVNMYMIRDDESGKWVLVDTGLKSSAPKIKKMAQQLFGSTNNPSAIILTHGHFDHVGSLLQLAEEWNVPIYCHYLELPYLSGKSSYPPSDPSVSTGLISKISWMFPMQPINVEDKLNILPPDGRVPFLSEWQYIYTPGHAPGHVSLFRKKDRVLIAGDAITTTISESVMSVMTQKKKLSGPPKYFTYDWEAAKHSVNAIANLKPEIIATGHGMPMEGREVEAALNKLAKYFDEEVTPKHGRYVDDPALVDSSGVTYIPPKEEKFPWTMVAIGVAAAAAVTITAVLLARRKKKKSFADRLRKVASFDY